MARKGDRFVVIGGGRVGTAVGYLLSRTGREVAAVACRSEESLKRAGEYIPGSYLTTDMVRAAKRGNVLLITTPDDLIADACITLASAGAIKRGSYVVHMSGALGLDVLEAAEEAGAATASVHPLQTFADVKGAVRKIPGSVFAVTARDPRTVEWAEGLVRLLGGEPVRLAEENKVLYHLGAVMASNLLVALEHAAELLYQEIGMEGEKALRALLPLIEGTVGNLRRLGTEKALTGPVARGDIGIVRRHLEKLEEEDREKHLRAYVALTRFALDLAEANLSRSRSQEMEELLERYS
ncbi:MAG: DUF2520 domain-containing protein [Actinobacteria bacterium]|nr:DUF2520 domain-containing protein [Actinomycetota bacterium]